MWDFSPLLRHTIMIGASVKGRWMEIVWGWLWGHQGKAAALFPMSETSQIANGTSHLDPDVEELHRAVNSHTEQ